MRPPTLRASWALPGELVIDNFAGGGGASTGIEEALGRPVDIAINHDAAAIAMHAANHPHTHHFCENIWEVDPWEACGPRPVGLVWFSPDCTHFSKAKGASPVSKKTRGLAWVVLRWARAVRPRVIILENVEEFQSWGPLRGDRPDPERMGETFRTWLSALSATGYRIEFTTLVAADYGTPTTRKRLFLIARRDGAAPRWPLPTHGRGTAQPWRPASEVIDWSLPCPSIFNRHRPLAEATLRRIAVGLQRYVIGASEPFVMPLTHQGGARGHGVSEPLPTITVGGGGHHALLAPLVTKHYGGVVGHEVTRTLGTITARDHHALTAAFLMKYYGTGGQLQRVDEPLHTLTGRARFGLVLVHGEPYEIVDIGMRMLQPHELFAAQGFPDDYEIAPQRNGRPLTKTEQISLVGNSVCPPVACELVGANI